MVKSFLARTVRWAPQGPPWKGRFWFAKSDCEFGNEQSYRDYRAEKCGRSAMFLLFRYCLRCASERCAILQIREQMMKKYSDFKFNYYCYSWWWRNFIFHEASDLYHRSTYTHSQTHGRMENLSETCLSIKLILVRVIGVLIQPSQVFTRATYTS